MLKYELEKTPGRPLYEDLYNAIKRDILSGKLLPRRRLPSKRELAADNDVSITTVLNAYRQLLMEGYIVSEEKKGYFVADVETMERKERTESVYEKYYEEEQWMADFRANNTLYHYFPYATWRKVIGEILTDYDTELVERGNPFGIEDLRREISNYLYRVRGIDVSPECIIVGAGIEFLYGRLITLFNPNTIYAVENPGYKKIAQIYEAYHLRWKSVEMDAQGISMDDLRVKDVSVAHVSPEHHYPLGTLMPISRRQELLAWAEEFEERYIIEDDYDCEFRYNSRSIPALKSFDTSGKVIYMNTFSKTLSPAVRISYMVLPEDLLKKYIREMHFFTNSTSSLEQYAMARFIRKGYFERHLTRIKKLYRQEGERLQRILMNDPNIPLEEITGGQCGTHLLVKLKTEMPEETIRARAGAQGINIGFLSDFCFGDSEKYRNILVLNYSDLDEATQTEAVKRLGEVFVYG